MKSFFLTFFVLVLAIPAFAEDHSTGVGLTLGSPNGITGRTWVNQDNSLSYGAGWNLADSSRFQVYADYLWVRPDTFEINDAKFDLFFGGGLGLRSHSGKSNNELVFGPRLPVGVSYEFTKPDVEVFAQFALNVGMIPSSDVYFDLHLGARFYIF